MKNLLFFTLIVVTQLICFTGFSQKEASYFSDTENKSPLLSSSMLINANVNSSISVAQINVNQNVNSVVLSQVGLYNVADINQSRQTQQEISQFGNKNHYTFIDYYNSSPINFSVLQEGDANSLQIYGSNSIINGMKIIQKSNFKNIVIKNYK